MLHLHKYIILFILLAAFKIFPQTITSIDIKGERIFPKSDYIEWCGYSQGSKYFKGIEDSLKTKIALHLGAYGYFNSSIKVSGKSVDTTGIALLINIDEGKPVYINKIFFKDADSADVENYSFLFKPLEGEVYETEKLEKIFSTLLTQFENNGYPFAKISIVSLLFGKDTIKDKNLADLTLFINKEIPGNINRIEIKGNKNTDRDVILREIDIVQGEQYSQKKIKLIPEKLNRLKFFEPVAQPTFYINSKKEGTLVIEVKEKETNNFDGIIGYMPGDNKQDGYFTGLVNVGFRNLFGTGRAAAVRWQKPDRLSQELDLKYLEPWLIGFPFNFNVEFYQKKQDSSYVQRKYDFSLEYLTTNELSASLLLGFENIIPTDNGGNYFTVYNSNLVTTGVSIKIDTRDDPYAPLKGLYFLNTYTLSKKKITGPEKYLTADLDREVTLQRIKVDFSFYLSTLTHQVAALGLHGRELQGTSFEVSDLYLLGGTNTLRGYKENQFAGSRIVWSNLEYRFLLSQRSFAFLFYDYGYYFRKAEPEKNILELSGYKSGYGMGLNIETGLGVMTVSFALAKGDTFSQGKIHFGLVNDF